MLTLTAELESDSEGGAGREVAVDCFTREDGIEITSGKVLQH